jgi:hypothetical protein
MPLQNNKPEQRARAHGIGSIEFHLAPKPEISRTN